MGWMRLRTVATSTRGGVVGRAGGRSSSLRRRCPARGERRSCGRVSQDGQYGDGVGAEQVGGGGGEVLGLAVGGGDGEHGAPVLGEAPRRGTGAAPPDPPRAGRASRRRGAGRRSTTACRSGSDEGGAEQTGELGHDRDFPLRLGTRTDPCLGPGGAVRPAYAGRRRIRSARPAQRRAGRRRDARTGGSPGRAGSPRAGRPARSSAMSTARSSCGSRPATQSCGVITTSTSGSTPWFSTPQPASSNQNA